MEVWGVNSLDYPSQTVLYVSPEMITNEDVKNIIDFQNKEHILDLLGESDLKTYFDNQKLHIAKDYQTKELIGFMCEKIEEDEDKIDYYFIKHYRHKLRVLKKLLYFIYDEEITDNFIKNFKNQDKKQNLIYSYKH